MNKQIDDKSSKSDSLAKAVGKGLINDGKNTVKWGLLGAVVLGGAGWFKFEFKVGLIWAGIGATVGGTEPTLSKSEDLKQWDFLGNFLHPDFPNDLGEMGFLCSGIASHS